MNITRLGLILFVRDLLIAIVCVAITLICGSFAGLGLLIAIDTLPSEGAAIAAIILAPPAILIVGQLLRHSPNPLRKLVGNVVFVLGMILVGSSLGFAALYLVRPRGADDYGPLYSLCALGGLVGIGIAFRNSSHRLLSRPGTMIIVLSSFLATRTVEVFSGYSYVAAKINLSGAEHTLVSAVGIALLIAIPAVTAVMLGRASRKAQVAG